uniref:Uncharacterized protein n=1 Tax=viral metagenome TaxID=1070528 RepID=A0A6H1ZMF2_9ZZZZ
MNPSDLTRWVGAAPTWLLQVMVNGVQTNPANNTLLVDTGVLGAGIYDVFLEVVSTSTWTLGNAQFEFRNAANGANNQRTVLVLLSCQMVSLRWSGIKVQTNERFRVYVYTGFSGIFYGSIWAVRRG